MPSLPSRSKTFVIAVKITQKQLSKFSVPVQFRLVSFICSKYFIHDCSWLHLLIDCWLWKCFQNRLGVERWVKMRYLWIVTIRKDLRERCYFRKDLRERWYVKICKILRETTDMASFSILDIFLGILRSSSEQHFYRKSPEDCYYTLKQNELTVLQFGTRSHPFLQAPQQVARIH